MKPAFLVLTILLIGSGGFWQLHRQNAIATAQRAGLDAELISIHRRWSDATQQQALLEAEWSVLRANSSRSDAVPPTKASADPAALHSGPPGGAPFWPETETFSWIEKKALTSLGLVAFQATDSPDRAVSPGVMRLLNRVGQQFSDVHPEFGRLQDLSPEEALQFTAEYKKAIYEATSTADETTRKSVESMMSILDSTPMPGRMSQPPAEYRLNDDVATVLDLSAAEREAVNQLTRDIVQRHQALERMHVAPSDDHSPESMGRGTTRATFKVAAFPDAGRQLQEEWRSQLAALVGPDRSQYLLEMSATWIRSDLGNFGEAERTITFREGRGSYGISDRSTQGHYNSMGTGGPTPVPPGWRHLIARPLEGGLPALRY